MKKLINEIELENALTNFPVRNKLLKRLRATDHNDSTYLPKIVLSQWLGANFRLPRVYHSSETEVVVNLVYYCFLYLDKTSSTFPNGPVKTLLAACQNELFQFYNEHFELLKQPKILIHEFNVIIITKLPISTLQLEDNEIIIDIQGKLLHELSRFNTPNLNHLLPSKALVEYDDSHENYYQRFANYVVKRMTLDDSDRHPFYPPGFSDTDNLGLRFKKKFLPAADGAILDALIAKEVHQSIPYKCQFITLALVGHFPNETNYISGDIRAFQMSFFTTIAFLNHRYFTLRSFPAKTTAILAADVVEFAKYYHAKNKKIILYGMCGGAAHMILAALELENRHIPFRLILDRFTQHHAAFSSPGNVLRLHQFVPKSAYIIFLWWILIACYYYLKYQSGLLLTGNFYHFGNLLKLIPKEKVLVLQIRKRKGEHDFIDAFCHPADELRAAQKEARKKEKALLKKLQQVTDGLSQQFSSDPVLKQLFMNVKLGFDCMLMLIQNEKLSGDASLIDPNQKCTNLHTHKILSLTTRHHFSTTRLLQGFIAPAHADTPKLFAQFAAINVDRISQTLNSLPHFPNARGELLVDFITTLATEKDYLSRMADRAEYTVLTDIKSALKGLLLTPLFLALRHSQYLTSPTLFSHSLSLEIKSNFLNSSVKPL